MYEHARFETKVVNNKINFHLVAKYILKSIGNKAKKKKGGGGGKGGRENENNPLPPPPHSHMRNHGRRELKEIFVS